MKRKNNSQQVTAKAYIRTNLQRVKDVLNTSYKPKEVLDFCANCNNYKRNYSCPDFDFDPLEKLEKYTYVLLIQTCTDNQKLKKETAQLEALDLRSRVFYNYYKQTEDAIDNLGIRLSMFAFDYVKSYMEEALLKIEKVYPNVYGMPPGSCTRCDVCLRQKNIECCLPQDLRFSLESFGFKVSDVYSEYFDYEMTWSEDEISDEFTTISALLGNDKMMLEEIADSLQAIDIQFE